MSLLDPYRWILAGGLMLALVVGYFAWEKHIRNDERAKVVAEYNKQIEAQKADAQKKLAEVTAEVDAKSKALQEHKDAQENTDVINEKTISILADKLHSVSLRDPSTVAGRWESGSSPTGQVTASSSTCATDIPAASGVLSQQLTDYLISQAKLADIINNAYISCRADSLVIRQ